MSEYKPMTRDELAEHQLREHGRDHARSGDGWDDMELAEKRGWKTLASWGRDGWNLGNWPYVSFAVKDSLDIGEPFEKTFLLQQVVEGDHTVYRFSTPEDRERAIDYLFLRYAAGTRWAPLSHEERDKLDKGELAVDSKWRGPVRFE